MSMKHSNCYDCAHFDWDRAGCDYEDVCCEECFMWEPDEDELNYVDGLYDDGLDW